MKKSIQSIRFETTMSGPLRPGEDRVHDVQITREGVIVHEIIATDGAGSVVSQKEEYRVDPVRTEAFLDSLVTDFRINQWKVDFGSPVLEGRTYEVTIRYADGEVQCSRGTVDLPPGGEAIRQAVRQLAAFKKEPWIF